MFSYFANPKRFDNFARIAAPLCGFGAAIAFAIGLYFALYASPEDSLQRHSVRIMYVHVPAAWCALMAYMVVAGLSFIAYIWRHSLADHIARAAALVGTVFTALALITGSIWGKTSWNTWWQWDPRLTSMLILLFIFIGYLAVWSAIEDRRRAARIAQIVAMMGVLNVVIVKVSAHWRGIHQKATLSEPGSPGLDWAFARPLLIMTLAYTLLFAWAVMRLGQGEIKEAKARRRNATRPASTARLEDL